MVTDSSILSRSIAASGAGCSSHPPPCRTQCVRWHLSFRRCGLRIPHPQRMYDGVHDGGSRGVVRRGGVHTNGDIVQTTASTDCGAVARPIVRRQLYDDDYDLDAPSCKDLCLADCESDGDRSCLRSATHKGPCGRCAKFNCDKRCEARCGDDPRTREGYAVTECMPPARMRAWRAARRKVNSSVRSDFRRKCIEVRAEDGRALRHRVQGQGGRDLCDGQFVNAAGRARLCDELKAQDQDRHRYRKHARGRRRRYWQGRE